MAISLPSKRFWIFAIILIGAVVVGLWLLGRTNNDANSPGEIITATELTPEEKLANVEALVLNRLSTASGLTEFDPADIPKTEANLSPQANEDRESVGAYAAAIAQALSSYNQKGDNEAELMVAALDTRDQAKVIALVNAQTMYQGIVVKLEAIPVPQSALPIHTLLVTSLKQMIYLLGPMSQVLEEPVLALQASEVYLKANAQFFIALNAFNQYFRNQDLQFSDEDQIKATF